MRALTVMAVLAASTAQADITVDFPDGAPKDRITITNMAACATGPVAVTIDPRRFDLRRHRGGRGCRGVPAC